MCFHKYRILSAKSFFIALLKISHVSVMAPPRLMPVPVYECIK